MKKMIRFLLLMMVLLFSVATVSAKYQLMANMTFEGFTDTNGFNKTGGTWTIDTGTIRNGAKSLRATNGGVQQSAHIDNSTFYFNSTDGAVLIKGWVFEDTLNDVDVTYFMYPRTRYNRAYAVGIEANSGANDFLMRERDYNGGTWTTNNLYINFTDGAWAQQWLWMEYFHNDTDGYIALYENDTTTLIHKVSTTNQDLYGSEGYTGFFCFRNCIFDDVEIWQDLPVEDYLIDNDTFTRANSSDLGTEWTSYNQLGTTTWVLSGNTGLFIENAGNHINWQHWREGEATLNYTNVTKIEFQFKYSQSFAGAGLQAQYTALQNDVTTNPADADFTFTCISGSTNFMQCTNATGIPQNIVSGWSTFKPDQWYNMTFENIDWIAGTSDIRLSLFNGSDAVYVPDYTHYHSGIAYQFTIKGEHTGSVANYRFDNMKLWGEQLASLGAPPPVLYSLDINTDLVNNTVGYNQDNITINYTGTIESYGNETFTCDLFVDENYNQTDTDINISQQQNFFVSWGNFEGQKTFRINCSNPEVSNTTGVYYYSIASAPSVQVNTDLVNNTINYNDNNITINYNGTIVNTDSTFTCDLYVDGLLNQTDSSIDITTNQNFFVSWFNVSKYFTFEVQCANAEVSNTSGVYTYNIDSRLPRINFMNPTGGEQFTQVLDPNITFFASTYDENYFAFNDTLRYQNGSIIRNDFQQNLNATNTTEVNLTFSYNPSDLYIGNWTWDVTVWDSHTANEIAWDIVDLGNGYDYDGSVIIWAEGLLGYNAVKNSDRYTFEFTISGSALNYKVIHLESDAPLIYLSDSYGYDEHFVTFTETPHWIDFVSPDVEDSYVVKLDDFHYDIYVLNTAGNRFRFESIGDLNVREKSVQFEILGCPEVWVANYTACTIGDNQTLYYTDSNACGTFDDLPLDNGTISSCNYCTPDWTENVPVCEAGDSSLPLTYDWNNFETCCNVTGLATDCNIPANTTQSCIGLHDISDITGLVIDTGVEIGITYITLIGIIVIIGLVVLFRRFV